MPFVPWIRNNHQHKIPYHLILPQTPPRGGMWEPRLLVCNRVWVSNHIYGPHHPGLGNEGGRQMGYMKCLKDKWISNGYEWLVNPPKETAPFISVGRISWLLINSHYKLTSPPRKNSWHQLIFNNPTDHTSKLYQKWIKMAKPVTPCLR